MSIELSGRIIEHAAAKRYAQLDQFERGFLRSALEQGLPHAINTKPGINLSAGTKIFVDLGHNLPVESGQKDEFTDPTTVIIPIHKYAAADFLTLDITDTLRSKVVNGNFSNNELEIELS